MTESSKKVVVVGLGALGSNLLLAARQLKVNWTIVDFDRVEVKNFASQFHTYMTFGHNKAQSVSRTLSNLFKIYNVKPVTVKLNKDNVSTLLQDADLVVDCVDNVESRKLIVEFCKKNKIQHVHAGLAEGLAFAIIRWGDSFSPDEESEQGVATCEDGRFTPFIMKASAQLAEVIQEYFTDGAMNNYNVGPTFVQRL